MKKNILISLTLILCIIRNQAVAQETEDQTIKCTITGQVAGSNCNTLLLVPLTGETQLKGIKIPVIDGRFEYLLNAHFMEKYYLIFDNEHINGLSAAFFPDCDTINFELHPKKDADKNIISGGELTDRLTKYQALQKHKFEPLMNNCLKSMDSLQKNGNHYSELAKRLDKQIKETNDEAKLSELFREQSRLKLSKEWFSDEFNFIFSKMASIAREMIDMQNEYIKSNIDPLSYSLLYSELIDLKTNPDSKKYLDIKFIKSVFPIFQQKYPTHPYTGAIIIILDIMTD